MNRTLISSQSRILYAEKNSKRTKILYDWSYLRIWMQKKMYMRIKHNKNVYIWKLGTRWWYLRWIKQPINFSHKISLLDSYLLIAQNKYNNTYECLLSPGNQACSEPSQRTKHPKSKTTHCPFLHLVLQLSGNWHGPCLLTLSSTSLSRARMLIYTSCTST